MKENYVEMNIDEMKSVKEQLKIYFREFKDRLKQLNLINVTNENRWELLALEKSYEYFINEIRKINSIYSRLINLGENDDLDERFFLKQIKEVQKIHTELRKEFAGQNFKSLEEKYISTSEENVVNL